MISYADFEFAITRWKARAAGVPQPAEPTASGMVQAEVPVATAPESESEPEPETGAVAAEGGDLVSGAVLASDQPLGTSNPDSESN
jgi:hypothetical protein